MNNAQCSTDEWHKTKGLQGLRLMIGLETTEPNGTENR